MMTNMVESQNEECSSHGKCFVLGCRGYKKGLFVHEKNFVKPTVK